MKELKKDWSIPDKNGNIDIPDNLMPLFNKIGFQFRFVQLSGKNEILAVAHAVQAAEEFFTNVKYEKNKTMERKLELKDIAGYLPYGLVVEIEISDEKKIYQLTSLSVNSEIVAIPTDKNKIGYSKTDICDCVPILRPLSDLYRTVIHNGKEIVPIVEMAKMCKLRVKYKTDWVFDGDFYAIQGGDIYFCFEDGGFWSFINGNHKSFGNQIYNQHQLFDYLHELKIDYRGLIDAGLAIDVNTIENNPYK